MLLRCLFCKEPSPPPLFPNVYNLQTDELLGDVVVEWTAVSPY
jgi:hypothetical protein